MRKGDKLSRRFVESFPPIAIAYCNFESYFTDTRVMRSSGFWDWIVF